MLIHHNLDKATVRNIKAKKNIVNLQANLAWSFLAGNCLSSDWSPIRFRNMKILGLKRAQSI